MHPHRYRICIGGGLSTAICEAFEGFTIGFDGAYTTLVAVQQREHGARPRPGPTGARRTSAPIGRKRDSVR